MRKSTAPTETTTVHPIAQHRSPLAQAPAQSDVPAHSSSYAGSDALHSHLRNAQSADPAMRIAHPSRACGDGHGRTDHGSDHGCRVRMLPDRDRWSGLLVGLLVVVGG